MKATARATVVTVSAVGLDGVVIEEAAEEKVGEDAEGAG